MKRGIVFAAAVGMATALFASTGIALAATTNQPTPPTDFNLQVTPSPLVTTVKPGTKTQVELKIRNGGSGTEELKIEPRSFTFDSNTGKVNLQDTTPPAVASWINFSAPKFTVPVGQWYSEQITFSVPKGAGFSYSFALVVSRQNTPKPVEGSRAINGSLAVFALVNVDRPGATSSIQVVDFSSDKKLYEYLPASIRVRFKNNGNTIVQPYGNIFIQRGTNSTKPLATLKVNANQGYILPGTERTMSADWNDGFATYQSQLQPDGSTKQHLEIDWSKLSHFRIGQYTAHLVAVYSDGQHDVPINGTVSFWVIPWRALSLTIVTLILLVLFFGWRGKRRTEKAVKRALAAQEATQAAKQTSKDEANS